MDVEGGIWDTDLVFDIFEEREANIILSIPVNIDDNDTWYWRKEKLGNYSVKSAYAMMQDCKFQITAADNSGFWRCLWNLKIPPKVKNFLWRACSNCLPTKEILCAKKIAVLNICPVCNDNPKSILHCLVTCWFAELCLSKMNFPAITGDFQTFQD